ncbi:hypothetical protein K0M31_017996, partial [Melipona bicolor]
MLFATRATGTEAERKKEKKTVIGKHRLEEVEEEEEGGGGEESESEEEAKEEKEKKKKKKSGRKKNAHNANAVALRLVLCQSVREVSLSAGGIVAGHRLLCVTRVPFPAAYFFPIGCVERGDTDSSSSSTSGVNSHDGEEVVADRIDSRRTQARWLGRIRVCPPVDIVGRGGESRVA